MREDILAKRMFYGGCCFLPWLWAVNAMYFRRKVFGDIPFIDTWGGSSGGGGEQQQDESIQDLVPRMDGVVEMAGVGSGEENDEGDSDGVRRRRRNDGEEFGDDRDQDDSTPQLSAAEIQMELSKWVKRSTFGAFFGFSLFISWIVVFQVNKDHFGEGWFVMDQDEEDLTGW
uniref:Gamma-secretase subunit PEN-2 n=1 Tax=Helicotheca tamesis TaxID=374047 RepID=A0A7S2HI88_9STRA